jgi:hypothetical protein
MQNNIFVIDENEILIFDQFGNGIGFAEGKENFTGIKIIFNELVVNTDEKVFHANLRYSGLNLTEINLIGFENDVKIISSFIFNNKFYLLTKRNILVFNKSEL